MRKGTTPTHIFTLDVDTSNLTDLRILYAQEEALVLEKTLTDCVLEDDAVSVTLTEDETFLFAPGIPVKIQVRIRLDDGSVLTSDLITIPVKRCLKEEKLS